MSSVAIHYQRGCTAEDILRDFPQLTATQVYGALAYYFDHQEEVREEIEQLKVEEKQMSQDPAYTLTPPNETRTLPGFTHRMDSAG